MSPLDDWRVGVGEGFPRVSGDEPLAVYVLERHDEFSPRERG